VEELLLAASLAPNDEAKLKVYTTATEVYPEDWRGFNDVAFYEIQNKNYDAADAMLQKANTLSANNDIVLNNLGVIALSKNDLEKAKQYFNDAKAKGNAEAKINLAPIFISEGDYAGATAAVSGQPGDLNLALSQILSGDLPSAKQTLAAAKESPKAFYLKAIVAAREGNANDVYANLKNTSAEFKKQAQTDVEFKKFADQVEFTNAVK
jgi:Flp pilus assembly protein TadD